MIQQQMLQYQQLDGEKNRIEKGLKKSEAYQKRKKYKALRQDYEDQLNKLDAKAGELKTQLAQAKQLIAKINAVIDEHAKEISHVESNDELNYMNKKLDEQLKLLANAEKEIRRILQSGEELAKLFDQINANLPKVVAAYNSATEEFNSAMEQVKPRVNEINTQLAKLESQLDPKLFEIYKRISSGKIFPVFVPLKDGTRCGGCQMDMPRAVVENQMQQKGIMRCEHCGRIIYSAE